MQGQMGRFLFYLDTTNAVDCEKRQRLQSCFTVRQGTQAMARQKEPANEGPLEG
jgi:hypothetical protein